MNDDVKDIKDEKTERKDKDNHKDITKRKGLKNLQNLLPVSISRVMPRMPRRLLAVRRSINNLLSLIILRRQFNRVRVIETCHHNIPILMYSVLRVHVVVVQWVRGNPHFGVVVGLLC